MKRRILALLLAVALASALLTGCGGAQSAAEPAAEPTSAAQEAEPPAAEKSAAAESTAAVSAAAESAAALSAAAEGSAAQAGQEAAGEISPYAWQGLEMMPKCAYLDAFCTYHYRREYTSYAMGYKTENIEAIDGVNSYKESGDRRTYSVDGHVIVFNDSAMTYYEQDIGSSMAEMAAANIEESKAGGTNMPGRSFITTGTGVIPEYGDTEGDQTEYEYYEFDYPAYEEYNMKMVERFYLKDGDVFAVYQETTTGDTTIGMTEVVQSMSGEIPEGTFDIPDTEGYEKIEL